MQTFSSSIEEHPLLVYLTALPFTPVHTLLYKTFMTHDLPRIGGGFNKYWPPLLHMVQLNEGTVLSVAFFQDGTRVTTSSQDDNTIRVWDTTSGIEVLAPLVGHTMPANSLAVSADGLRIASGSNDCSIRLWDTTVGAKTRRPLIGHSGAVQSVAFSPDGTYIASGSVDRTIRVWDVTSSCAVIALRSH